MHQSRVLVRFLSLVDVTLIVLGYFIIFSTLSGAERAEREYQEASRRVSERNLRRLTQILEALNLRLEVLWAGWEGSEFGKFYRCDVEDGRIIPSGEFVPEREKQHLTENTILLIVLAPDGWYQNGWVRARASFEERVKPARVVVWPFGAR